MSDRAANSQSEPPNVALFVTCLVDLMRPSVGFAAVRLLEQAGCYVHVPATQTCCGQPAYNSGDRTSTRRIARQVIAAFEAYDYVVVPSGSCAGMLRVHFERLFDAEPDWQARARALAERTFELTQFLTDVRRLHGVDVRFPARAAYHDSCSGLRELGVKAQPRALLSAVSGLVLHEYAGAETCCGFGGTFCVKYPEISDRMVAGRAAELGESDADALLGGDLGCLFNIAGKLKRAGSSMRVYHVAEVLAGMTDTPAIGEGEGGGS